MGKQANNPSSQGNPEEVVTWRTAPWELPSSFYGGGKDVRITTVLCRVQLTLLRNRCLFFTQTAPNLPGKLRKVHGIPSGAQRAQKHTHLHVLGWERMEGAWLAVRERATGLACSCFLAKLLIRSGTLGDSFNLSLSQIQTSTSSYYNIWLHYGIVERLN